MFKHDSSVYAPSENRLLAHVFKKQTSPDTSSAVQDRVKPFGRGLSHQLSSLTGVGERTCRKAIAFARTGTIGNKEETDRPGRLIKELDESLAIKIRDIITQSNKKGIPSSASCISNELRMEYDIERPNLIGKGDEIRPRRPKVFLDESYCHLDHATANRWVPKKGGIVSEPGWKPLLVIFAVFVVSWNKNKRQLQARFVRDSVYI
ncbi:hypothetical protein BGZ54_003804 [Gamsiella multidivaricata]|nr:hypothetical protein BGZ54_003804 [Gamsiella multidivaricata]